MSTTPSATTKLCPKCDAPMVIRRGPIGDFWGCPKFPECRGNASIKSDDVILPVADNVKATVERLEKTLRFIMDVGGLANAYRCLRAAQALLTRDNPGTSDEIPF